MLTVAEPYLEKNMHPTVIIRGFFKARDDAIEALDKLAIKVDISKREELLSIIRSCLSTKFVSRWMDLMCDLALDSVSAVVHQDGNRKEIDIKRYVKIEKVSTSCHPSFLLDDR
jgi:T-complex protein 1 subunit gamma